MKIKNIILILSLILAITLTASFFLLDLSEKKNIIIKEEIVASINNEKNIGDKRAEEAEAPEEITGTIIDFPEDRVATLKCDAGNTTAIYFQNTAEIVWTGEITSHLSGGSCYGVKRSKNDAEYPMFIACALDGEYNWSYGKYLEGSVSIKGKWSGMDCGYCKTAFDNSCVPYVEIERIIKTGN